MSILFINACVRENSRTLILAREILKEKACLVDELCLQEQNLQPLNTERLKNRDALIARGQLDDNIFALAKQFANAEEIVIAAPFWDLSFPALLKIYLENIMVGGITFHYDDGKPIGLCRAKKLTYVTTAGGKIFQDFGYSYVKALALNFYGIQEVYCERAENLDVLCVQGEGVLALRESVK